MSDVADRVGRVRSAAGVFRLADRGVIDVTGDDRDRWLNGMVSNDVEALSLEPGSSGCYALRLDRKGRILADLHVWRRQDRYRLELAAAAVHDVVTDLDRFIIADDVELLDRSADFDRVAVEGPAAPEVVAAALGSDPGLGPDGWCRTELDGMAVSLGAFGFSGEPAVQWLVPAGEGGAVAERLLEAARAAGVDAVAGDDEVLEILRIEAGIPAWGREIDLEVFPDEAGLGRTISTTKGCYTGQEIVARLRSRGQVNHLMVGLRFEGERPAPPDADLGDGERRTGEVTSSVVSPALGPIGLGYVRRDRAEPGTELRWEGGIARVAALPQVDTSVEPAGSRGG